VSTALGSGNRVHRSENFSTSSLLTTANSGHYHDPEGRAGRRFDGERRLRPCATVSRLHERASAEHERGIAITVTSFEHSISPGDEIRTSMPPIGDDFLRLQSRCERLPESSRG